jgi:hypothetical protein
VSDETHEKPETKPAADPTEPEGESPKAGEAGAPREAEADEADESDDEAEAEEEEPVDAASPEAIAKRVAALGAEDETERIAREEEQKLAERRRKMKGGKKKGGLEAAASKKLSKIGAKAPPPKRAIATAADVDPILARTTQLSKWAKQNQKGVGIAAVVALTGLVGFGGYTWWEQKQEASASIAITQAVADERGRIGDPDKEKEDETDNRPKDPRPLFKTAEDRREAALAKYRDVESKYKGTGAAYLARLEEAALLLDKNDVDGAIAAFNDAKSSPLGQADNEVKGRALEGIGFAHELKSMSDAANKDAHLDDAIKAFRELENTDIQGFKELGMYHQARCYEAKGDKDRAKELLKSLHERLAKPGENHPFPYLEQVADDRLRALDPTALPPKPSGAMGGGPGGNKMTDEQIKRILEQMKQQAGEKGGAPPPPPPPAPKK